MLPAWFDPTINLATLLTLASILAGGWLYLRTRSDVTRRRHHENQLRLIPGAVGELTPALTPLPATHFVGTRPVEQGEGERPHKVTVSGKHQAEFQ